MKVIKTEKQKAYKFNFGDKVKVLTAEGELLAGTTAIVQKTDSDGDVWVFSGSDHDFYCPDELELLEPSSKESVIGKYEEGQKFRVVVGEPFNVGDIVTLTLDDGSRCPRFTRDSDGQKYWEYYSNLEPLAADGQENTVILELTLEELRLIEATSAITSYTDVERYFNTAGFPKIAASKKHEFYREIIDIRKEAE